jgi:hypothetical protein
LIASIQRPAAALLCSAALLIVSVLMPRPF